MFLVKNWYNKDVRKKLWRVWVTRERRNIIEKEKGAEKRNISGGSLQKFRSSTCKAGYSRAWLFRYLGG